MSKQITLTIPTDWAGVNLKKYLALRADMETYKDDEEAITAVILMHLCGLEPTYLQSLPVDVYNDIKDTIAQFINNVELPLQKFINIDGIEYGFEPNLSKMAYGAYADISKYDVINIDDNWAKVMNILYRPVTHKKGELYSIETYTGKEDYEKFLDVPMDVHFGALFFLLNLQSSLLNSILKSSMEMEALRNIRPILEKNGAHIQRLLNWQKEIFTASTKL
jgi:hypothetical protein